MAIFLQNILEFLEVCSILYFKKSVQNSKMLDGILTPIGISVKVLGLGMLYAIVTIRKQKRIFVQKNRF